MVDKNLDKMMKDSNLSEAARKRVRSAAKAFSAGQIARMRKASIRIWPDNGVPTEWQGIAVVKDPGGRAYYSDRVRTIFVRDRSGVSHIRHEFAHAWDHTLSGKLRGLDGASRKKRERAIQRNVVFWSHSDKKRKIVMLEGGQKVRKHMTVRHMYKLYKKRPIIRERRFNNPSTSLNHSTRNLAEFFAEAYSVFFGPSRESQAKMLAFAPEVFALMEWLAGLYGLSKPKRETLEKIRV